MAICYRDITYCISPNCKNHCGRKLTDQIREDARKWWAEFTKGRETDNPPIAMAYYCDENGEYVIE